MPEPADEWNVEELPSDKISELPQGVAADLTTGIPSSLSREPAFLSDPKFFRIVALSLGWTLPICAIGAVAIAVCGGEVPQILTALGSGTIGAFAGVLIAPKMPRD